ncbi:hypothetical protein [Candidatus Lokiarchaeum ossiferum]|uniref:hypothetical protein n=1 Tax=Candidatus Lokiarchaeum ossiferum TaxID=2951803 RepID=UPI00352E0A5A
MTNYINTTLENLGPVFKPLLDSFIATKPLLDQLIWDNYDQELFKEKDLLSFLETIEDIGNKAQHIMGDIQSNLKAAVKHNNFDFEGEDIDGE